MAPVLRASTPEELDLGCNLETYLCSTLKNEDSMQCHPWESRGRRLFPQRRPSIPTTASCNVNAISGFPPFEATPSRDNSHVNYQEYDSDTSSSSSADSIATVKVCMSPTPDRPFPEKDPRVGEDTGVRTLCMAGLLPGYRSFIRAITPHKSSNNNLQTSSSAALYTDTPARGNLQWKSMAQFHESGHRMRPKTLSQLPNGERTTHDADISRDPLVPIVDTVKGNLPLAIIPHQLSQWNHLPEIIAHPELSPTEVKQDSSREEEVYVATKDQSRSDASALKIATWDCTVKLSTIVTVASNGRLHVHHLALLSVMMPVEELYAEKISLSFVVTNALRNDHRCSLGLGQSSLLFKEDVSQPGFFPREGVELIIVRHSHDFKQPLSLYFAFTYPSTRDFVAASLPTFRPKEGRSLSEVVFIAEPLPPLNMTTFVRDRLSSWKLCHHPVSQVTCYERINLPRLYPASFQDDIQIRVSELDPVRFQALGESTLSSVVWNLDITIYEPSRDQVDCRMSFFLEVGAATALVSLDPHGWVPRYFIVGGRVATEKVGECWKNKNEHITIFKQDYVGPGPIMVETYWQGPPKHDPDNGYNTENLPLPRVADRKVLGGRLACRADEIILLNHLGEKLRPHGPVDETGTILPTMDAGHRIILSRVTKTRPQETRRPLSIQSLFPPIPEKTQLSEHTVSHSDVKMDHKRGLSHAANHVKAPRQTLVHASLRLFLFLVLLVLACLPYVEHIRKGSNHNNAGISWRDQDPSMMRRDGERLRAVIDEAGSDPVQPAVAVAGNAIEAVKCEGWRDWVDYGSGWKGCSP